MTRALFKIGTLEKDCSAVHGILSKSIPTTISPLSVLFLPLSIKVVTGSLFLGKISLYQGGRKMLITARNIIKSYGKKQVLKGLDLEIEKGSMVAYLGTNGAGKSTTINILSGLLALDSGQVIRDKHLKMGMVFQDSVLDGELSVAANLKNRLHMYKAADKDWLKHLIEITKIQPILKQKYQSLSGGQKRRVDIVRALINKPDILFLDEPTTGLDIQSRELIWYLFNTLQKEEGLTIFLTTHYLEEAETADKVYVIDNGNILASGKPSQLIADYAKSQLILEMTSAEAMPEQEFIELEPGRYFIEGLKTQEVITLLNQYQKEISSFSFQEGTLNEAFLTLTGKEIQA
ncbi:ABC transporter, ATP-binding protein [Streptococcus parauberis KRS-02109]|nr:ABC transporter ATP-binding protein [Streptococcus parauberis KCTC 11537]EMF48613.1 ABC transporter, ATP-binding protein [Streptococcus parauberis KRS-02109]